MVKCFFDKQAKCEIKLECKEGAITVSELIVKENQEINVFGNLLSNPAHTWCLICQKAKQNKLFSKVIGEDGSLNVRV